MNSIRYEEGFQKKVGARAITLGTALLLAIVALSLALYLSRKLREQTTAQAEEISALVSKTDSLSRSLDEAKKQIADSEKREHGFLQVNLDLLSDSVRSIEQRVGLVPKIGQTVSLKGQVINGKAGPYLSLPLAGSKANMGLSLRETEAPSESNTMLNQWNGRYIEVTGTLHFGQSSVWINPINQRRDCLYIDLAECRIEEVKEPVN